MYRGWPIARAQASRIHTHRPRIQILLQGGRGQALQGGIQKACVAQVAQPVRRRRHVLPCQRQREARNPLAGRGQLQLSVQLRAATTTIASAAIATTAVATTVAGTAARKLATTAVVNTTNVIAAAADAITTATAPAQIR